MTDRRRSVPAAPSELMSNDLCLHLPSPTRQRQADQQRKVQDQLAALTEQMRVQRVQEEGGGASERPGRSGIFARRSALAPPPPSQLAAHQLAFDALQVPCMCFAAGQTCSCAPAAQQETSSRASPEIPLQAEASAGLQHHSHDKQQRTNALLVDTTRRTRSPPFLSLDGDGRRSRQPDTGGLASPALMFDMELTSNSPCPPPDDSSSSSAGDGPPPLPGSLTGSVGSNRSSISLTQGGGWGDLSSPERGSLLHFDPQVSPSSPTNAIAAALAIPPTARTRSCILPVALKTTLNGSVGTAAKVHTHSDSTTYRSLRASPFKPSTRSNSMVGFGISRPMAAAAGAAGGADEGEVKANLERIEAAQWEALAALHFPPAPPLPLIAPPSPADLSGAHKPLPSPPRGEYPGSARLATRTLSRSPINQFYTPTQPQRRLDISTGHLEVQQSLLNAALAEHSAHGGVSLSLFAGPADRASQPHSSQSSSPTTSNARRWNKSWMVDVQCDTEREIALAQAERASRQLAQAHQTAHHVDAAHAPLRHSIDHNDMFEMEL